jgi:hypothetical protein
MAKQTIKVKHLGIVSTGKFASIFAFIFSSLMLIVWGAIFGGLMLFSMLLGSAFGGLKALFGMLMGAGVGFVGFIVAAVAFVLVYTLFGFIAGMIGAFAFNTVVKLSGGLSFDAEIV